MNEKGKIVIQCFKGENTYVPIDNVKLTITPSIGSLNSRQKTIELTTNNIGKSVEVDIDTPSLKYSQEPSSNLPYSFVDIKVDKPGFQNIFIKNAQVFPDTVSIQNCSLIDKQSRQDEIIEVLPNKLVGNYPSKIPEDPDKILPPPPSGTVVLPKPIIPEFLIVHQGSPNNPSAPNYKVKFKDYIKNVASCEIFPTWSENTIRTNIYCIISFTLNRVYTEWYKAKGKNFTISSSTAYDHAFNFGRNIFDTIDRVVEDIFSSYIRRIGKKQPLLTQYCDGKNVKCPGWLTQWGSKYLGDDGKSPYEILTSFYGTDIELTKAEKVAGIPESYPGYTLAIGSRGQAVKIIQNQLNRITKNYPLIPKVVVDGIYGSKLSDSVKEFQKTFRLSQTGDVNYATWYKISDVYVGVTKIAEIRNNKETIKREFIPPRFINDNVPHIFYLDDL